MYRRKRIGPRTEPCGTPYGTTDGVEIDADDLTNCVRPAKYEVNHERTTPSRPYDFCNRVSKVSWSTLSNAG